MTLSTEKQYKKLGFGKFQKDERKDHIGHRNY